jgi:hypothetical protein
VAAGIGTAFYFKRRKPQKFEQAGRLINEGLGREPRLAQSSSASEDSQAGLLVVGSRGGGSRLGVFTIRDGKITAVREYLDTQHVKEVLFPDTLIENTFTTGSTLDVDDGKRRQAP